jgi:hypothetical protein
MMSRKPMGENMGLDMPFGEAMERFIGVKPREMEANIAKSKKKKPPGGKKKKRSPPGKKAKSGNVILLKDRKTSLRRRGLA